MASAAIAAGVRSEGVDRAGSSGPFRGSTSKGSAPRGAYATARRRRFAPSSCSASCWPGGSRPKRSEGLIGGSRSPAEAPWHARDRGTGAGGRRPPGAESGRDASSRSRSRLPGSAGGARSIRACRRRRAPSPARAGTGRGSSASASRASEAAAALRALYPQELGRRARPGVQQPRRPAASLRSVRQEPEERRLARYRGAL